MLKKSVFLGSALFLFIVGVVLGTALRLRGFDPIDPWDRVSHFHSSPTIERVKALASLVVLKVDVADVQLSDIHGYTGGVKAALILKGDLTLSTDLAQAKFQSVDKDRRTAVLILPPPQVSSPRLDQSRTRLVWVWTYGLWDLVPDDLARSKVVNAAYAEAQDRVAAAGRESSLDKRARSQAESVLGAFFDAMGWTLTIRWSDDPAAQSRAATPRQSTSTGRSQPAACRWPLGKVFTNES